MNASQRVTRTATGLVAAVPSLDHARRYIASGWRIFPIRPRTKRPLNGHGSTEATSDPEQIEAWWRRWPAASIGGLVPYGRVVLDLDPRNGCALRPERLPETLAVQTGGGGWHLHFTPPPAIEWMAHSGEFPGVDLIRWDRQVVLPPSLHPSGEQYRWLNDAPVALLPGFLVEAFARRVRRGHRGASTDTDEARRRTVERLEAEMPFGRNVALNRAAFHYRHHLDLSEADALADLLPVLPVDGDFTEREARYVIGRKWR